LSNNNNSPEHGLAGAFYAIAAFSLWGVFPLYFKAVSHLPAFEVLAHRIVWSAVFVGVLLAVSGRMGRVWAIVRDKRLLRWLAVSAILVSVNWLIFIWAVDHDRVLETSLGYFINPLVNVALGLIFLKERLNPRQWLAVGLSAAGVAFMIVDKGVLPWVALSVAFSFGFYGLVRKVIGADAYAGLFVETVIVLPPVLGYLIYVGMQGTGAFTLTDWRMNALLMLAGLITAAPLVLFAEAAKRLRLATVGFFQYIAPTGHFVLAVFVFAEPFTSTHWVTFALIWLALAIYTADGIGARRRQARA